MFYSELDVEVYVVLLANSNILYFWLYLVNSPQEQPLVVVLGVLDDASGKINAVNHPVFIFEGPELESVDFLHDIKSEVDEFVVGKGGFVIEEGVSHSFDCRKILLLVRCELPRLDVDGFPDELVVVFADCEEDD